MAESKNVTKFNIGGGMNNVTREQFEIMNDVEVRHIPTGAKFSTYRYLDPNNAANSVRETLGRAGQVSPDGEEYDSAEIHSLAIKLLQEQAINNGKDDTYKP